MGGAGGREDPDLAAHDFQGAAQSRPELVAVRVEDAIQLLERELEIPEGFRPRSSNAKLGHLWRLGDEARTTSIDDHLEWLDDSEVPGPKSTQFHRLVILRAGRYRLRMALGRIRRPQLLWPPFGRVSACLSTPQRAGRLAVLETHATLPGLASWCRQYTTTRLLLCALLATLTVPVSVEFATQGIEERIEVKFCWPWWEGPPTVLLERSVWMGEHQIGETRRETYAAPSQPDHWKQQRQQSADPLGER